MNGQILQATIMNKGYENNDIEQVNLTNKQTKDNGRWQAFNLLLTLLIESA